MPAPPTAPPTSLSKGHACGLGFGPAFSLWQKRGLENTLHDAKHWHDIELQNLGAVVSRLEAELRETRSEAEQQQQAREHLLAHKAQLQRDVASYHALLDREESW